MPPRPSTRDQADLLTSMGEEAYSAQHLQQPIPMSGAIARRDWFRDYAAQSDRGTIQLVVISYDVATKPSQASNCAACTIWGMTHQRNCHLLECRRVRLAFPDHSQLSDSPRSHYGAHLDSISQSLNWTEERFRPSRSICSAGTYRYRLCLMAYRINGTANLLV